jgi:RNA polymerase sigma-70 factor (ECF subfamily)
MNEQELIPHLFRNEFRKITAVLCKQLGTAHITAAEDIAGETFLAALDTWPYKGIPQNPQAWLYAVAKNKAQNYLKRHRIFESKISPELQAVHPDHVPDFSEQQITDSQLQMLFVVCHPALAPEAQISLALRILCGFGIEEIADALLSNKETINKRLYRAKEKLRSEISTVEMPAANEIGLRLDNVLTTLYLLFSEGYYSESSDAVVREDLCLEAMRLTLQLLENPLTNLPHVNALFALMCFHASRLEARKDAQGELILYDDQDESLWNQELIARGVYYLHASAQGQTLSTYHLEANIAYWHTVKTDSAEKWETILDLYNQRLIQSYSPVAALNRTYALARARGKAVAIPEAEKLQLATNPYYFTLLGELYTGIDDGKAQQHLQQALKLARTQADKNIIRKKLEKPGAEQ